LDKVLIGEILAPLPDLNRSRERRVREGFWRTFARAAARIPFAEDLVAAYYCALDPATPGRSRAILFAALAYFVLPADFVPDFIAVLGFGDDIAVLTAAIGAIRGNIRDAHYEAARRKLAEATKGPAA